MKYQRGIGTVGLLLVAALVLLNGTAAIKVLPAYFEFFKVRTVLSSFAETPVAVNGTRQEMMTALLKRMKIDDINTVKQNHIEIKLTRKMATILVNYEVRKNLFSNLDLAIAFNEKVEVER